MTLSIGELSAATGVKIPTIRYYEQIELVSKGERDKGNRRRYGEETVHRLLPIRGARDLGYDMEAIRDLLRIGSLPVRQQADAVRIAQIQLVVVRQKIAKLEKLQRVLTDVVDGSQSAKTTAERLFLLAHEAIPPAPPAPLRSASLASRRGSVTGATLNGHVRPCPRRSGRSCRHDRRQRGAVQADAKLHTLGRADWCRPRVRDRVLLSLSGDPLCRLDMRIAAHADIRFSS